MSQIPLPERREKACLMSAHGDTEADKGMELFILNGGAPSLWSIPSRGRKTLERPKWWTARDRAPQWGIDSRFYTLVLNCAERKSTWGLAGPEELLVHDRDGNRREQIKKRQERKWKRGVRFVKPFSRHRLQLSAKAVTLPHMTQNSSWNSSQRGGQNEQFRRCQTFILL